MIIPYGGTFLVFSDYMRGALRLSALSHYPSIWVFTHDSIGLGEDGPTHQPVEHLAALRAMPNMLVIRPGDANEVREAWKIAIQRRDGPTALVLTRQNVPTLDRSIYSEAQNLKHGAYVLADLGGAQPQVLLMATGSELSLIVEAGAQLSKEGVPVRLVSFPSWELFKQQPPEYQEAVLPKWLKKRVSVEAGVAQGWERWIGDEGIAISIEKFGSSAPYKKLYEEYGLTVEKIVEAARSLLKEPVDK